MINYSIKSLP